mmetsp:Transcript_17963/g.41213  ORF Transcript_17963/g.41213 Transcript_17963/m.41213 type:complete len:599 (+) Transcript_17963:2156-3952(+)
MISMKFILPFCVVAPLIIGIADGFQQSPQRNQAFLSQRWLENHQFNVQATAPITNTNVQNLHSRSSGSTATSSATQLNAVSLSSSPIGAVAVLAGIVVVHECGHYLAARAFNITVDEFSVGFGPKVVGFEAFGNEFNLRALPLGGYVRFPENYDSEAVMENEDLKRRAKRTLRRERKENAEDGKWNWEDEVLDAATLGYWNEKKLEESRIQKRLEREEKVASSASAKPFWMRVFGGSGGDIKKEINQKDGDSVDIDQVYQDLDELDAYQVEYYDDPQLLQNRPWPERAIVLSGGVICNLILAFTIYFAAIGPLPVGTSQGLPRAIFDNGVVVAQAPRPDGPSNGLLQRGDIITEINGKAVVVPGSLKTSVAAGQQQVTDVISAIRGTPDGESVSVSVLRGAGMDYKSTTEEKGMMSDATSAKQTKTTVRIQPMRADDTNVQSIGVMLSPRIDRLERLKSDNPIIALQLAWEYLSDIFTQTLLGTLSVLTSFLSPSGPPPGQKISGPIGLISQGSSVVATKDWTAVLLFAAGLSVNLGVINALPLPALDGGQLVFVVAEAITGKKVDQKLQERVTSIAVLFLLWVSFSAAIGDVGSLFQ